MGEIVQVLNEIKEAMETNTVPVWVVVITGIAPIVLTAISILSTYIQYRQNIKLQKAIHNRDVRMQSRENILQIYKCFCIVQNTVGRGNSNLAYTFSNQGELNRWLGDLNSAGESVCQAMNQANLFFKENDPALVEMLENCRDKFLSFQREIWGYINSGKAQWASNAAWQTISPQLGNLNLWQNPVLLSQFIQLCDTDDVKRLKQQGDELLACFEYDKFDVYFEKYLKIDQIK